MGTIYLASQSPRRLELLGQLGIEPTLLVPTAGAEADAAEALEAEVCGEPPDAYVARVTDLKLDEALRRLARRGWPPAPVLCADTTVWVGDCILGKPLDADDARRILRTLSGQVHQVSTALALAWPDPVAQAARQLRPSEGAVCPWVNRPQDEDVRALSGWRRAARVSHSRVWFAPLTDAQIDAYVASGEPQGKAGAYAIQGRAAAFIERIDGSHSGIMGLPLYETAQLLSLCTA